MNALLFRDRYCNMAHLVSRDPCRPGQWRASRFDARGAAGHVDCNTREDAIRNAIANDADVKSAREVTASTIDAAIAALAIDVCTAPSSQWTVMS
jgi:hypothetical protein